MGFTRENVKRFLSQANDGESLEMRPRGERSRAAHKLRNPCMANIAQTAYTKISGTEMGGMDEDLTREPHHRCRTLIEALWVLLVGAHRGEGGSTTQDRRLEEPCTVEALAVMVHLTVKSFGSIDTTKLGACNNMEVLHQGVCDEETKFIPVAAITGGLFGVNLQIYAKGYCYHIINRHYGNTWPVGSLAYKDDTGWLLKNLPFGHITAQTPSEPNEAMRCHHGGTYRAYTRLNDLRVIEVGSDGYCGFHAILTLLNGTRAMCDTKRRKELAEKTATFVYAQRRRSDITTYLKDNQLRDAQGLVRHITQKARWLDVQDVRYILEAHGKTLRLITENSYPLYEATCAYVLIKNSHYEPLLPV